MIVHFFHKVLLITYSFFRDGIKESDLFMKYFYTVSLFGLYISFYIHAITQLLYTFLDVAFLEFNVMNYSILSFLIIGFLFLLFHNKRNKIVHEMENGDVEEKDVFYWFALTYIVFSFFMFFCSVLVTKHLKYGGLF